MVRRILGWAKRILPTAIPFALITVGIFAFWSQNHATFTRDGDFYVTTETGLSEIYPSRSERDEESSEAPKPTERPVDSQPVARKYVMTRRSGLNFFHRGHNTSFESEIPDFYGDSPFLRSLGKQLRRESEELAIEFTVIDWSDVFDSLRDPQSYLQNWSCELGVEVVHASSHAASVLESRWEYTGGAHGNMLLIGRSFVASQDEARAVTLDELFDPESDWRKMLLEYCLKDLKSQGATSIPDVTMGDTDTWGFTTDDLSSFTLSSEGLRFYFSPYHVGSYAEGIYTVYVPYTDVRDYFHKDSPAWKFLPDADKPR